MASSPTFAKGDILIEFGWAYTITKVVNKKNQSGETEPFLVYEPIFSNNFNKGIQYTIPASNVSKTNKRPPMTKEKIKGLLATLKKKVAADEVSTNAKDVDAALKSNSPEQVIDTLRLLVKEKNDPEATFSYSKQRAFERSIEYLAQEVAVIYNLTLPEAEEMITKQLPS